MTLGAAHCYPSIELLPQRRQEGRRKQGAGFVGYHARFGIVSILSYGFRNTGFGSWLER